VLKRGTYLCAQKGIRAEHVLSHLLGIRPRRRSSGSPANSVAKQTNRAWLPVGSLIVDPQNWHRQPSRRNEKKNSVGLTPAQKHRSNPPFLKHTRGC
jgi:hypothetical protein